MFRHPSPVGRELEPTGAKRSFLRSRVRVVCPGADSPPVSSLLRSNGEGNNAERGGEVELCRMRYGDGRIVCDTATAGSHAVQSRHDAADPAAIPPLVIKSVGFVRVKDGALTADRFPSLLEGGGRRPTGGPEGRMRGETPIVQVDLCAFHRASGNSPLIRSLSRPPSPPEGRRKLLCDPSADCQHIARRQPPDSAPLSKITASPARHSRPPA